MIESTNKIGETHLSAPRLECGGKYVRRGGSAAMDLHCMDNPDFKVDYLDTWTRFYTYLLEDFVPDRAVGPLKLFARYYAQNFVFRHTFYTSLRNADRVEEINEAAVRFLSESPATVSSITAQGV